MDELTEQTLMLRYLAKKAKELYRENLAYRAAAQHLKDSDIAGIEELKTSALASPELHSIATAFERAVDARMPQSEESDEDALVAWIQSSGLDRGPVN